MQVFTHDEAYAVYEGTNYWERHQATPLPEGFVERLQGKGIKEQLALFAVVEHDTYRSYSYGEEDGGWDHESTLAVEELKQLCGVIVENGLVEGIMVKDNYGQAVPLAPGDAATTYYASDDDGTGGSYRNVYVRLVCRPVENGQE